MLFERSALQSVRDRYAHLFATLRTVDVHGVACFFFFECMRLHDVIMKVGCSSA